jgi:Anti-sigma-K factor rskA
MKDPEKQERLFELLSDRALFELNPADQKELNDLLEIFPEWQEDESFDLTAAAISLSDLEVREEMPADLQNAIKTDWSRNFAGEEAIEPAPRLSNVIEFKKKSGFSWNRLGWATAAAACVALIVTVLITRAPQNTGPDIVSGPGEIREELTTAQMRQRMMDTSADMTKADWTAGNMTDMKDIGGDVVWSDAKQAGYMRLKGLPANDGTKETYQLWIFDETQDPKTPIDGGVFNVNANGEVIIPINAKLKARNPKMFAITVEKPGGVVVSDRKKIAALAKVQV